jgi:short-subunit dehydrogenase
VLECSPFANMTVEVMKSQSMVNAGACTVMCKIVIARMLKRQGKSAIVNVGSITSDAFFQTFSHYGSTKAYIDTLSKSMETDYRGNIDVMCVKYGPVLTEMEPIWVPGVITAESAARQALSQLGYERVIYGHWLHEILAVLTSMVGFIVPRASGIISSNFLKRLLSKKKAN